MRTSAERSVGRRAAGRRATVKVTASGIPKLDRAIIRVNGATIAGFRLLLAVEKASEGRQVPVVSGLEDEPGHDGVGGARSTAVRTSAPRYETAPCKGGDRRADQAMRGLPSLLVSCR